MVTDEWALGRPGTGSGYAGVNSYDTFTKVYPPLRSQRDVDALVAGLAAGVIDCVATDHAPHDLASKQVTYNEASFGISVLETALGTLLQLVHQNRLSVNDLVERLTVGPARILGERYAELATLREGTPADITVFDPQREWVVDTAEFVSKGKNTPLQGTALRGRVMATVYGGAVVFQDLNQIEMVG
jgi:dihydroorotase